MKTHVTVMDETGRLTVPEDVRRSLDLTGVAAFELDVKAVSWCSVPPTR